MVTDSKIYKDADLYRDSARIPLSAVVSRNARIKTHEIFRKVVAPAPGMRIVDIGVSDENSTDETNMLERLHPWPESLTCVGIHAGVGFRSSFPSHRYVQVKASEKLPFPDQAFDVAYSNAVIEHVGSDSHQQAFVAEMQRVSRRVFIVVPNRLFPIEHHTGLPLVHWLPLSLFRGLIKRSRLAFWAKEENLNPITVGKLRSLFPPGTEVKLRHAGVGWGPFRSNLIAYT